jgi:hypothetical protein
VIISAASVFPHKSVDLLLALSLSLAPLGQTRGAVDQVKEKDDEEIGWTYCSSLELRDSMP